MASNAPNTGPIPAEPSQSVTIGPVTQGTAASLSGAWPVEVTDGTNILGTVAHPVNVSGTNAGGATAALQSAGNASLATIATDTPPLGQAVSASSTPVVIASDQTPVSVSEVTRTLVGNGVFIPGTSATQLPTVAGHLYYVTACAANTGKIYLGGSGVTSSINAANTTTGLELQAGTQVGPLPLTNLNQLYAIGTVSTDAITYLVL